MRGAQRAPRGRDQLRADEARTSLDVFDLALREIARVHAVQARNVRVALRLERQPVVPRGGRRKAVVDRVAQGFADFRGVPHDFLRHAADVHAGAAETAGRDETHSDSVIGGALRTGEAAAAATDDQKIELVHERLPGTG